MKSESSWIHFFKISSEVLKTWESESQCPLTAYWCLLHNKIDQKNFTAWAQAQYGLPHIQSEFFQRPIDKEFWNLIRQKAAWSEQFIPIGEWEGSVFVACAEPPQKDSWGFSVRYALSEAKTLESYWKRLSTVRVGELPEVQSEFRNQGPLTIPKEIGDVLVTNLPLKPGEKIKEALQVSEVELELMRDEGQSSPISERPLLDAFDATRSGASDKPLDISDRTQAANSFPKLDSNTAEGSDSEVISNDPASDLVLQNTGTFDFKFDSLLKKRKPFGS